MLTQSLGRWPVPQLPGQGYEYSGTLIVNACSSRNLNERLARRGTMIFGSMWTFYAFVLYGALGAVFVSQQSKLLYWSNWIQLSSMPLLMVGGLVLERASERRSQPTYEVASSVLQQIKQVQAHLDLQDERINALASTLSTAIETLSVLQPSLDIHN